MEDGPTRNGNASCAYVIKLGVWSPHVMVGFDDKGIRL